MTESPLRLYHHPFTRAANVVWMLEEVGRPYELEYVDLRAGQHRRPPFQKLNRMTKLPTLVDGDTTVTESAAIGLYLADRYASGTLAPPLDDPTRGDYFRWSFYAPSVIEPGCYAKAAGWEFKPASAGWGRYDDMIETIVEAIGDGPWVLGDRFTMADVIFGGTLRFMLQFEMIEERPEMRAYVDRLNARPAAQAAQARNAAVIEERGLGR